MSETPGDPLAAWRAAAERVLRGKPLDSLTWHTEDGFDLPPLVTAGDVDGLPHLTAPGRVATSFLTVGAVLADSVDDNLAVARGLLDQGYDRVLLEHPHREVVDALPSDAALVRVFDDPLLGDDPQFAHGLLAQDDRTPLVFGDAPDGGTPAQQVALVLLALVRALRRFDPETLAPRLMLAVPVGPELLSEVAKLRALRLVVDRVCHEFGVDDPVPLLATQSSYHDTRIEPHTNLLRGTLGAVAATVAGVELISLAPFDSFEEDPPSDSSRLALNQLRLLREESFLDRVHDPATGSHAVEALTHGIGSTAWGYLQTLESDGWTRPGAEPDEGSPSDVVGLPGTESDRLGRVRRRQRVVVGVNRFSDPSLDTERGPNEFADVYYANEDGEFDPLLFTLHAGLPFEWLRDRVLWFQEDQGGRRPGLQALRFGPRALARARSEFAADFFRAGGFRVEEPVDTDDVEAALAAADDSDASAFVLCGPDPDYLDFAPAFVAGLRATGSDALVYVAGPPPGDGEDLGITGFVHRHADAWELLCHALDALGLPRLPELDDDAWDDDEPDAQGSDT